MEVKQYGFIEPTFDENDYTFGSGALRVEILQEDGQWDEHLPPVELQRVRNIETVSCVAFATLNAIEILLKKKYGEDKDFSERYTAILAETDRIGTTPKRGAEAIRKQGVISDELLPFSEDIKSWSEYHSPTPMLSGFLEKGAKWLENYDFGYDWVFTGGSIENKRESLIRALQSSPVGVSVYAWVQNGEYYIKPEGVRDTHWTVCYGYVEGAYWKIFDTYDNTHKKLVWDYNFGFAQRYTLDKKESVASKYASGSWKDWWKNFWLVVIIKRLCN